MNTILIIIAIIYMIPGYVFGIFAWDSPSTNVADTAKKVIIHTAMTIGWLPFVLWTLTS